MDMMRSSDGGGAARLGLERAARGATSADTAEAGVAEDARGIGLYNTLVLLR